MPANNSSITDEVFTLLLSSVRFSVTYPSGDCTFAPSESWPTSPRTATEPRWRWSHHCSNCGQVTYTEAWATTEGDSTRPTTRTSVAVAPSPIRTRSPDRDLPGLGDPQVHHRLARACWEAARAERLSAHFLRGGDRPHGPFGEPPAPRAPAALPGRSRMRSRRVARRVRSRPSCQLGAHVVGIAVRRPHAVHESAPCPGPKHADQDDEGDSDDDRDRRCDVPADVGAQRREEVSGLLGGGQCCILGSWVGSAYIGGQP
jgi:hypothetical protein